MIFFVCLSTVYIKSAQADFTVRDGFNPMGTDSINIQTGTWANNSWVYNVGAPTYFGIYLGSTTSTTADCSEAGVQRLTSMGGYSGIQITPNVLLVIYNSTLNSTAQRDRSGIDTQRATFDAKGNLSVNTGTQMSGRICYDIRSNPSNAEYLNMSNVRTTIGDLQWGIYVKPGTPTSELKVSNILIGKIDVSTRWASQALSLSGQTLRINPPMKCAIAAPPTVDFGPANITGVSNNGLIAFKKGAIDINCSSDLATSTADVKIAFTGSYSGTYWGRLDISNSSGGKMAYIRGRYLDANGLCAGDSANEIGFSGDTGIKTLTGVKPGLTKLPITWSLCSNGSGLLGQGTAQATATIEWQ